MQEIMPKVDAFLKPENVCYFSSFHTLNVDTEESRLNLGLGYHFNPFLSDFSTQVGDLF
jgi:hypothetical protein